MGGAFTETAELILHSRATLITARQTPNPAESCFVETMSSSHGWKRRGLKDGFAKAKRYDDINGVAGDWSRGKAELNDTCRAIAVRPQRIPHLTFITTATAEDSALASGALDAAVLSEFQVHGRHLKDGDQTHTLTKF